MAVTAEQVKSELLPVNGELTVEALEAMTVPEQVEKLAGLGLTMKQLARCIGIGESTLYRYMNTKRELRESLKRGRAKGLSLVANALHQNALSGNVVAQIFYLKNRSPEQWQDRRELQVSADQGKWVINAAPILSSDDWFDQAKEDSAVTD